MLLRDNPPVKYTTSRIKTDKLAIISTIAPSARHAEKRFTSPMQLSCTTTPQPISTALTSISSIVEPVITGSRLCLNSGGFSAPHKTKAMLTMAAVIPGTCDHANAARISIADETPPRMRQKSPTSHAPTYRPITPTIAPRTTLKATPTGHSGLGEVRRDKALNHANSSLPRAP